MWMTHNIFITGGTGYLGSGLIPRLVQRGHRVTALARPGSEYKLPEGIQKVTGDPLRTGSYTKAVRGADTLVHLIGVAHPSPAKARQFRQIDLVSARVAIQAARETNVKHFVYLSVAQPAPVMHHYIAVRAECETILDSSGLKATFLRPWYVLGPGHRWPCLLLPVYWLCACLPALRAGAQRLGLVTLSQMVNALVWAVENPPEEVRIIDFPKIRALASNGNGTPA
jgi:uncharacterized protein YbjT (DUF2867 family)